MTEKLPDAQLAEIRERVPSAVCPAAHPDEVDKDHVWVTGSLSGTNRCSACHVSQLALDYDEAVLLAEVDRLRAQRAAVVGLHDWDELVFGGFYCMHCTMDDSLGEPVSWPCPSLRAVGMTDEEALAIITAHRVAIAEGAGQ